MANELWDPLLKFQSEVAVPDMERIVGRVDSKVDRLRDEMLTNFGGLWKRLESLETEYHALTASVKRLETRLVALETRMTVLDTRMTSLEQELADVKTRLQAVENRLTAVDLLELKGRISTLEEKIAEHEK